VSSGIRTHDPSDQADQNHTLMRRAGYEPMIPVFRRIKTIHSCVERDMNPRSQCSGGSRPYIHASSGIRTHDPSAQVDQDHTSMSPAGSEPTVPVLTRTKHTCLSPHSHWDRCHVSSVLGLRIEFVALFFPH